jgi:hypothetical protein
MILQLTALANVKGKFGFGNCYSSKVNGENLATENERFRCDKVAGDGKLWKGAAYTPKRGQEILCPQVNVSRQCEAEGKRCSFELNSSVGFDQHALCNFL